MEGGVGARSRHIETRRQKVGAAARGDYRGRFCVIVMLLLAVGCYLFNI